MAITKVLLRIYYCFSNYLFSFRTNEVVTDFEGGIHKAALLEITIIRNRFRLSYALLEKNQEIGLTKHYKETTEVRK